MSDAQQRRMFRRLYSQFAVEVTARSQSRLSHHLRPETVENRFEVITAVLDLLKLFIHKFPGE